MNKKIINLTKKIFCFVAMWLIFSFVIKLAIIIIPIKTLSEYERTRYSIKYYDCNGKLLRWRPSNDGSWQIKLPLDDIPKPIINMIILAEDKRFYLHHGVDPLSLARSIWQNVTNKQIISGASTITMQLARMIYPHEKSMKAKVVEAFLAVCLECKKDKHWILEQYINNIPFGYNTKGYAAAAEIYFNKKPIELNSTEIAILSVIPRGPTKYNPYKNVDNLVRAASIILRKVDSDSKDYSAEIKNALNHLNNEDKIFDCPHFVNFVDSYLNQYCDKNILTTIDEVKTTINIDIQKQAQIIATGELIKYKNNRLNNVSLIVLNKNNEIVAYIGNPDFFDEENSGQIDGVQTRNQPGSTLKPFLYGLAFDNNFTPNMIVPDVPMSFGGEENYKPGNYNLRTNGPVRMRIALGSSLNIPAVYLINRLGVNNFITHLQGLGFESLDRMTEYPGAGLALGNSPVTLFELTRAFSVFSHNGLLKSVKPIKQIRTDNTFKDFDPTVYIKDEKLENFLDRQIYSESTAFLIYDILSDKNARKLGFKQNNFFDDRKVAAKTGTSNQFGNIWAIATWSDFTIGVWAGNFSGNTVQGVPGAGLPLTIVKKLVDLLYTDDTANIPKTPNLVVKQICAMSGDNPTDNCDTRVPEYFDSNDKRNSVCNYHRKAPNGTKYVSYPAEFISWASSHNCLSPFQRLDSSDMSFEINSPTNGSIFYLDPNIALISQAVSLNVSYKQSGKNLYYSLNGEKPVLLAYPYQARLQLRLGQNILTVQNEDLTVVKQITYTVK